MMLLGVDYYPEQWDEALMDADLDAIVDLGCNAIRIAEFAWHRMEPREGAFDFSFFDRVIEGAKRRGLRVILGTPTAAVPAWLAGSHPDVLSQDEHGQSRGFGGRRHGCYNSPVMREYAGKIARAMAEQGMDYRDILEFYYTDITIR